MELMSLYVTCGIPGSGKTTLAKELSQKYNLILYSYDELRANRRVEWGKLSTYILGLIRQSLTSNQSVIVDDLYITKESRTKLLTSISDIRCKKVLISMQTTLDACIERDADRLSHNLGRTTICNYNKKYEQPSLDEGWDEILYY
jgi:tRNA uridine 5-carbamoylmethylation protein Kti12